MMLALSLSQLAAMDDEQKAERDAFEAQRDAAAAEEVDDGGTGLNKAAAAMVSTNPVCRVVQRSQLHLQQMRCLFVSAFACCTPPLFDS
jgi:hypothetical protein